jgi:pimeloyl-ACP methyl ester carboxylesterase
MRSRLAAVIAACVLACAGSFFLRPVQTVDFLRQSALSLGGVRRVRVGTLAAYEEDLCSPGKPCRCIALIHGLGDSALTWDSVLLGKDGAARPPAGTKLLAVELPGSEGSLPPSTPEGYAVPAMADTVKDALQSSCPQWTVVGNSLGGWVAGWLALKWPAGVKELVLVNAAGLADPTGTEEQTARILEDPTPEKMKEFAVRAYHNPRPIPNRAWEDVVASIRSRPAAKMVAALKKEYLLDDKAGNIRADTIIVWGASDRVVPRAVGEGFARLIPGARLELVPDCGHLPQQECPQAISKALFPAD